MLENLDLYVRVQYWYVYMAAAALLVLLLMEQIGFSEYDVCRLVTTKRRG